MAIFLRLFSKPHAALIPWLGIAGGLCVVLAAAHLLLALPAQQRVRQSEADLSGIRQRLAQHVEAAKARKDVAKFLGTLPATRDFAQLPLALAQEAQRNNVAMPDVSYTLDKTSDGVATRAVLQGEVTGRYEDLRRFIHHLESSDRLLFIENLEVGSSAKSNDRKNAKITVKLKIATYVAHGEDARASVRTGDSLRASAR